MAMRIEAQCQNCACYYLNLDEEVSEVMETQAPGEECTCGMNPWWEEKCPSWIGCDED